MNRSLRVEDFAHAQRTTRVDRRGALLRMGTSLAGLALSARVQAAEPTPPCSLPEAADRDRALVAITLDLEMSRNFPTWEHTHWDYEKGNLDDATKRYALTAARRVVERGGKIHFFAVGRVLEQENIDWLLELRDAGHPIGNHTYDHVFVLAESLDDVQFRFRRAPWLVAGRMPSEVIAENIELCTRALRLRAGITPCGFRTPGGFQRGLFDRPDVARLIAATGFTWVSSLYPAHPIEQNQPATEAVLAGIVAAQELAQPFRYASGLIEVPMSPISDIGAFRTGRWPLADFLEATRRSLAWAIDHRATFDFLAHPSCLGVVDPELKTIDLICRMVEEAGERARLVDLTHLAARGRDTATPAWLRESSLNAAAK